MVETAAATPDLEPLKPADWTSLSDEKLLEVRMCDLGLTIAGTELEPRIAPMPNRARKAARISPSLLALVSAVETRGHM